MKPIIPRLGMLIATLLAFLNVLAADFEVDGFGYDVISIPELTCRNVSGPMTSNLVIPSTVTYNNRVFSVTEMSAWPKESDITSITFSNFITNVPDEACSGCQKLSSVKFGTATKSIGDKAFYNCKSLTNISIGSNIQTLGSHAFEVNIEDDDSNKIESIIEILPSVTSIGKRCFNGRIGRATIYGGNDEGLILYEHAFSGPFNSVYIDRSTTTDDWGSSISATNITIGPNAMSIDPSLFKDSDNLTIQESETCLEIEYHDAGWGGFKHVTILRDIQYPPKAIRSLTVGGKYINPSKKYLFQGTYNSLTLLNGIKDIGEHVFFFFTGTEVHIPKSVTNIGRNPFGSYNLRSISIAANIKTLGESVFSDYENLISVTLPSSLTQINENCFKGCVSLKIIELPENVSTISGSAFEGCSNLNVIKCLSPVPPCFNGNPTFSNGQYMKAEIYVPENSLKDYQAAEIWNNFWNIKSLEPVQSLRISKQSISILEGASVHLATEILPNADICNTQLTWTSDDESVATVENGYVYAKKAGSCKVTATTTDGTNLSSSCEIKVFEQQEIPEYVVEVDGVYYELSKDMTAMVIHPKNGDYEGDIEIPGSIKYNGFDFAVTAIDTDAFELSHVVNLKLNEGICSIPNSCFDNCLLLTSINIPGSVTSIGYRAFNRCPSLKKLTFDKGDGYITLRVGYGNLKSISSTTPHPNPSNVDERRTGFRTRLFYGAFEGLPIKELTINRNIRLAYYYRRTSGEPEYGYNTIWIDDIFNPPFYGLTSLNTLSLGENVSQICENTIEALIATNTETFKYTNFGGTNSIKKVISNNPIAPIGGGFSENVYANAELVVPDGAADSYKADEYWKNFVNVSGVYDTQTEIKFLAVMPDGVKALTDTNVIVYSVDGTKIIDRHCASNDIIKLNPGLYIITANGQTLKVAIQ